MSEVTSEETGTGPPPQPIIERRSEMLWLADRDIVLYTVQQTDEGLVRTMYGVRRSTLGLSSEFFAETFSDDQSPFVYASDTYDGLPMMQMPDDDADVDAYLRAIHFPGYLYHVKQLHKDPKYGLLSVPPLYYRILRLAQKYIAPDWLMLELESVFRRVWPSDLQKWKKRELRFEKRAYVEFRPANPDPDDGELRWDQTDLFPDPMSTYAFALKHQGIHDILPAIAYDIAHAQTSPIPFTDGAFRNMDYSLLSEQEGRRLCAGREVMRLDCARKLAFDLLLAIGIDATQCRYTPGATYADELACAVGLKEFWRRHVVPLVLSLTRPIDLLNFPTNLPAMTYPEGVCASCTSGMLNHLNNAQYVLWVKLPIYFRLTELVATDWGFGPDKGFRFAMLPQFWQREVMKVLKRGPGDGHTTYEQLRNHP